MEYTSFFESETNFDVIFMGTSMVRNHVLPMEIWKDYGISSYNWAFSNCTPAENYYLIKDIVKYTKPKVVVLGLHGLTEYEWTGNKKYRTDRIEQQHVQFDRFPIYSYNKYQASRDVFDDYSSKNDFIWNFMLYHNRWTELGKEDFDYDISTEKGAQFLIGLGNTQYTPSDTTEKTEINSVCYPYLLDTIEFCDENGIDVLVVANPFVASEEQQIVANSIGDVLEQYPNCKYINLLNNDFINYATDTYRDNGHLNYSAALKTSDWMGRYLRENYALDDYSTDASWIEDYKKYYDYKAGFFSIITNLTDALVLLSSDDFLVDCEIYDKSLSESELLSKLLANADIDPVYPDSTSNVSVKMTVYSASDKELVSELNFVSPAPGSADITKVNTIADEKPVITATPGNGSVFLEWNEVPGATMYAVSLFNESSGRTCGTFDNSLTTTSYTVNGLENGKTYSFVVQVCVDGQWRRSTKADCVRVTPAGDIVTDKLDVTAVSGDSCITLNWTEVPGAAKYSVSRYLGDGKYEIYTNELTENCYTVTGLENGTTYEFIVQAYVDDVWTPKTVRRNHISARPQADTTIRLTVTPGDKQVVLNWNPIPGAEKYTVARYLGGGKYETYTSDLTETSYTVTGLENDTTYEFIVQAYVDNVWTPKAVRKNHTAARPKAD